MPRKKQASLLESPGRSPWELAELVIRFEEIKTVYFYGPPGTGKTYAALHFGAEPDDVYCVTLTEETSAAELRGSYMIREGSFVWHDGPFVRAMREGKRLVINELQHAGADVLALLFPILESWDTARLTLPTGETLRPQGGFRVIATDNRPPDGLPEALQDRFAGTLRVTEPHPDALATLNEDLQAAARNSSGLEDGRQISVRGWTALQTLEPTLGLLDGCSVAFGPDVGPMVHDALVMARNARKKS